MAITAATDFPTVEMGIKDIVLTPGPYCMSFGFDMQRLILSIKKIGLVNNPVLIENSNGMFDIVTGFRRIYALKALGLEKIPCRIISSKSITEQNVLLFNFYENMMLREFNLVEKGMFLNRMKRFFSNRQILDEYMPLIGLPSNESILNLFCRLDSVTDQNFKMILVNGKLSQNILARLLTMEESSRNGFLQYLKELNFNSNQQKQFIDDIVELSCRSGKTELEILNDDVLKNFLVDPQLNCPQKAKACLRYLRTLLFPSLVKSEKIFNKMVANLDLPPGAEINAPVFFESADYSLRVIFNNGNNLRKILKKILDSSKLDQLCDPWETYSDE